VNVYTGEVSVLMYILLFIPKGHAVGVELCGIEFQKCIEQEIPFRLWNLRNVSAYSVA